MVHSDADGCVILFADVEERHEPVTNFLQLCCILLVRGWTKEQTMRNMTDLELYYNKFNEEKRLDSRHGQVEFITSMKYIHKYIPADRTPSEVKILDVGAGTGRYSISGLRN